MGGLITITSPITNLNFNPLNAFWRVNVMSSEFNTTLDRKNTASLKWEKYRNTDILPMWVADMDFPVASEIQIALEKRLAHPVHGYTVGTEETAEVVCTMLQNEYDWHVEPEWIVWLPGVVSGLWAACAAVGDDGDDAIFSTPIYHHFFSTPGQGRKTSKPVPLQQNTDGRWTYDFDALEGVMGERSRLMLLCSPHNPTGTMFTQEELQRMGKLCLDNGLVTVSDEIHCGLILSESKKHIPMAKACPELADSLITLMSPSKTFNLAGLNCSFAIIPNPELRKSYEDAKHSILPMVPGLAYTAMMAAYSDSAQWHQQLLDQLRKNHAYLEREIRRIPGLVMSPMEATYLAWINTDGLGVENAAAFFEEFGVGLSPGAGFGLENYVRLNFACPMSQLEEAIRRMKIAVSTL
ncbi:MAG: cystathionine beta-lyase [Desulforhopalus sp.]